MFYKTRIKSISNGSAVDVNGRRLTFIGWLPVKAGDTVFTDGKVIFGNAPPKGSPAIFDEPGGIPVLGDNELRGYFNKQGKYKKYSIKGDEWIVNSDKTYKHDNGEENIIDAEISDDGKLYTVEKKIIESDTEDDEDDNPVLFYHYTTKRYFGYLAPRYYIMMKLGSRTYSHGNGSKFETYQSWWDEELFLEPDYIKDTTPDVIDTEHVITEDYKTEIYYHGGFLDKEGDGIVKDCSLIIKENGEEFTTLKLSELVKFAEDTAFEYVNIEIPDEETKKYIKSRARLCNFKILTRDNWEAVIKIEIGAELDYPQPERNLYFETEKQPLSVYPYSPLFYSSAAVHLLMLFSVNSEGVNKKIAEKTSFMPLYYSKMINTVTTKSVDPPIDDEDRTTFPYYICDVTGFQTILNGPDAGVQYVVWMISRVWNSRFMPNAPDYDNTSIEVEEYFTFPVQDDFQAKIKNLADDPALWQFGGVFDKDEKKVIGAILPEKTDAHKWNMSLAELRGGQYLFGIRKDETQEIDGALFKIDKEGNSEKVGDGLKNFRLRELKKISKARR